MEIMKPIPAINIPAEDFVYEVKYDGFRTILHWTEQDIKLLSKRGKDLSHNFPEIIKYCKQKQSKVKQHLPLTFDGEIVILNNPYQANFSLIQSRGRLKNKAQIQKKAEIRQATFMVFDAINVRGKKLTDICYIGRKETLKDILDNALDASEKCVNNLMYVPYFKESSKVCDLVFTHKGEGIIAKRINSKYHYGNRHQDWFKIKNWRTIRGFLTSYDSNNNYFSISIFKHKEIHNIGKCKHGLDEEASHTLKQLFLTKGKKENHLFLLPPAVCASVHTLDLYGNELREPAFSELLPNQLPETCTIEQLTFDLAMFPTNVELSNLNKVFWDNKNIAKRDFLIYIREISPYMIPFLKDRALTVIRCPDGVLGESFFQKSLPSYAPSFIKSVQQDHKNLMVCDHLDALIWLANHGAVEYHIPFQTTYNNYPIEIIFDLDPPDKKEFKTAIFAAKLIKQILNDLELVSFIKTSGNKGLQIHIPIPKKSMSYEDTALFTEAIARTLVNQYPHLFTIERFKKNRENRLYIDYVQHGKDKTLIAPYSPRKTKEATIATPLYWDEVNDHLTPDSFTIMNLIERVQTHGCPFANFFKIGKKQKLEKLFQLIK